MCSELTDEIDVMRETLHALWLGRWATDTGTREPGQQKQVARHHTHELDIQADLWTYDFSTTAAMRATWQGPMVC